MELENGHMRTALVAVPQTDTFVIFAVIRKCFVITP